jgi:hypothetical protein
MAPLLDRFLHRSDPDTRIYDDLNTVVWARS